MDALGRIFFAAQQLQCNRNKGKEVFGIALMPESQELAKALGEAMIHGVPASQVVDQVTLAMGGNQTLALELMEGVQEIAKAHVEAYTRTLPNGKVVNIHSYESARKKAMAATMEAHGQGTRAMHLKNVEGHENASRLHQVAADAHKEAIEHAHGDTPEIKEEHHKMHAQHVMAKEWHDKEADHIKKTQAYGNAKARADRATDEAQKLHGHSQTAIVGHQAAAEAHKKAAEINPGKGHEEKSKEHETRAIAHQAAYKAVGSPHYKVKGEDNEDIRQASKASEDAAKKTGEAYQQGSSEAHTEAAYAHSKAMEHHLALHAKHEGGDSKGHHHDIAHHHLKLHIQHLQEAGKKEEVAKAVQEWNAEARHKLKEGKIKGEFAGPHESFPINSPIDITHAYELAHHAADPSAVKARLREIAKTRGWEKHLPEEEEAKVSKCEVGKCNVAKADGMTVGAPAMAPVAGQEPAPEATPAPNPEGHDIAQQTGTNAMMVEGRPKEDFGPGVDEVGKSHVEGHTRKVKGKVIQVHEYDTKTAAAHAKQLANHATKQISKTGLGTSAIAAADASQKAHEKEAEEGAKQEDKAYWHNEAAYAHGKAAGFIKDPEDKAGHEKLSEFHEKQVEKHGGLPNTQAPEEKPKDSRTIASEKAEKLSEKADKVNTPEAHKKAADAHHLAYFGHKGENEEKANYHGKKQYEHNSKARDIAAKMPTDNPDETIQHHLREAGKNRKEGYEGEAQWHEGIAAHHQKLMEDKKPSRKEELESKSHEAQQAMSHAHKLHHALEAFGGVANTPENRREAAQAHHDAASKLEALKGHTHKLEDKGNRIGLGGITEERLHEKIKEHKDKAHWHEYVASSQEKAREKAKKKGKTISKGFEEGTDYKGFNDWLTSQALNAFNKALAETKGQ